MKLGKLLKSLVHLRRIKNPKVLNPLVLMGIVGPEAAPADEMMWGEDPVHPKRGAYTTVQWQPESWTRSARPQYATQNVHPTPARPLAKTMA